MAILVSLLVALHADADVEFAFPQVGGRRKRKRTHRGFLHSVRSPLSADVKLVPVAPARDYPHLCGDFSFPHSVFYHLVGRDWIPADDQSELISSYSLPERHLARQNHQGWAQDMAERHHCPAGGGPGPIVYARDDQSRPLFSSSWCRASERNRTHAQMATAVRGILSSYRNMTYKRTPAFRSGR